MQDNGPRWKYGVGPSGCHARQRTTQEGTVYIRRVVLQDNGPRVKYAEFLVRAPRMLSVEGMVMNIWFSSPKFGFSQQVHCV